MDSDLILKGGKIVTMDRSDTLAEGVAVKFGRIVDVGSDDEMGAFAGKKTEVIELKGKTVIPGLIDSHGHFTREGAVRMLLEDLSEEAGVRSIADLKNRLAERAKLTEKGKWVLGYQEDDAKLSEKRHPTRFDLDGATRDHPILVTTVGGHFYVANSLALDRAGVGKDTPDPVGGRFDRDPKTGELTGGLHEQALLLIHPDWPVEPTREQSYEGAKQILTECAGLGLTCVYDTVEGSQIRAVIDLKNREELPIRVRMDVKIDLLPELEKLGVQGGLGDDWARICGLKFFFDGAISARTAAVTEPYLDKADFYGVMATTREIAAETILGAYQQGHRISAHANGDQAISMFLDIMKEAQERFPRKDPRNRAIHCTVVNQELVKRIKNQGILPTIFGPYVYYHGDKLIPAFGERRLEWMFAARSFLDAGLMVAAHSDHPCAPFPPLMAIHGLVNRTTKAGKPIGQSQRISVMEALKLYTINAAYQSFDEHKLGSIEAGKLADMVVLGEDILTVPSDRIIDIPVEMTLVEGRVVKGK